MDDIKGFVILDGPLGILRFGGGTNEVGFFFLRLVAPLKVKYIYKECKKSD